MLSGNKKGTILEYSPLFEALYISSTIFGGFFWQEINPLNAKAIIPKKKKLEFIIF